MPNPYSRDESTTLEQSVAAGRLICPICGGALRQRPVPPRADVSYVRNRLWLTCAMCDKHGVVDCPKSATPHPN